MASILEMLRVVLKVRIFPLLTLERKRSPYVDPVIETLRRAGYAVIEERVGYELQRGVTTALH